MLQRIVLYAHNTIATPKTKIMNRSEIAKIDGFNENIPCVIILRFLLLIMLLIRGQRMQLGCKEEVCQRTFLEEYFETH